jgi:DNA-directed RNA polymerase specialized sigma subunit
MEINELLNEICKRGSIYDEIMNNIISPNYEIKPALISELSLYILENQSKIKKVVKRGEFKYYFIRMCQNQVHSNTSPFHKNNRIKESIVYDDMEIYDDEQDLEYKEEKENQLQQIKKARKKAKLNWYEQQICTEYYDNNKTLRAIEKEYGIDHVSIYLTVKSVKEKIEKQINK